MDSVVLVVVESGLGERKGSGEILTDGKDQGRDGDDKQ